MHLCEIPESEITGLEIPNGLPIIFDWRNKCVKVRSLRDAALMFTARSMTFGLTFHMLDILIFNSVAR